MPTLIARRNGKMPHRWASDAAAAFFHWVNRLTHPLPPPTRYCCGTDRKRHYRRRRWLRHRGEGDINAAAVGVHDISYSAAGVVFGAVGQAVEESAEVHAAAAGGADDAVGLPDHGVRQRDDLKHRPADRERLAATGHEDLVVIRACHSDAADAIAIELDLQDRA